MHCRCGFSSCWGIPWTVRRSKQLEWSKRFFKGPGSGSQGIKYIHGKSPQPVNRMLPGVAVKEVKFIKERMPLLPIKPCGNNTVMKHIEWLRKVVNTDIQNEWLNRDPLRIFDNRLMKKTDQPVRIPLLTKALSSEVAYECGFIDQSHFIRTIEGFTGFLPHQYQKSCFAS